ncbi:MAG: T9SS type A sorting domain-containing protein [Prevotella sp.]|jgi:hypothetical protein
MRKTLALLLLSLLASSPTWAQNDKKLVVESKEGVNEEYPLPDVQRIDFSSTGITVVEDSETGTAYAFDEIKKITFTTYSTGISQIRTDSKSAKRIFISSDGARLTIEGWDASKYADLSIYSVNGARQMAIGNWNGQSIDITGLPHGIYVVKAGNNSGKFRK